LTEHFFAQLDPESQSTFAWLKENPAALHLRFIADVEESKALNRVKGGAIIISASGMCDAGRVLHHVSVELAPRSKCGGDYGLSGARQFGSSLSRWGGFHSGNAPRGSG
jgi:hypothetical protein